MKHTIHAFAILALCCGMAHAQAPVKVENAWARASVQGQRSTGAFMTLTSPQDTNLVAVTSAVAAVGEVHEMKMEGDVMRMRPVAALPLPAGKPVELKPGGYHLMLMELKMPLTRGTSIPLTLTLRNAQGVETRQEVSVPVSTQAPGGHRH